MKIRYIERSSDGNSMLDHSNLISSQMRISRNFSPPKPPTTDFPRWAAAGPYEQETGITGTKAEGLRYEIQVGKYLDKLCAELGWSLRDHPWIETAAGFLQPDFVLEAPSGKGILVECKLTWVNCYSQLMRYKIALRLLHLPCISAVACKNLTPSCPEERVRAFEDIYDNVLWHLYL